MTEIAVPDRIAALPKHRGYEVPWFVTWYDGVPDFRVADHIKLRDAVRFGLCWVCGQRMGRNAAFVIGPMCAINRVSSEPPAHRDCAIYSARRCPFLSRPTMQRRNRGLPEHVDPAGVMVERNPGVALVWMTRRHKPFRAPGGVLFNIGDPVETLWFAHGRPATRAEVLDSIESGMPLLRVAADVDGPAAVAELDRQVQAAMRLVPA